MAGTRIISLNGEWRYMLDREDRGEILRLHDPATDDSGWPGMEIPGNWQIRGVDDYCGKAWFRRTFTLPEACRDSHLFVRFSGVDYLAKVWLNGCLLGEHEGYFQPFEFPADHAILRDRLNVLVVRVDAPLEEPGVRWPDRKRLIKGIFSHHDTRPGSWDPATGQSLGTGGIWNDVEIVASGDVRITSACVTPTLLDDGTARIRLSLEVANYSGFPTEGEVGVALVPDNFEGARLDCAPRRHVWLQPGTSRLTLVEAIADPHLWWTWDHGRPDLYRAEVAVTTERGGDVSQARFGLRRFAVDADGNFSTFNVAGVQMGGSIDEFIQNSQSYQAALLKAATESYRLAKFRKIACLFQFMFVDCWPSITWSVVDYYRVPKQGYFALGRAFQPVLPCAVRDRERLVAGQLVFKELRVVNDLQEAFPGARLEVTLEDQHSEACLAETFVVDVPENQAALAFNAWPKGEAWTVSDALVPGRYSLKLALRSSDGRLLGENEYPVEILATPETFNMSF
ncbi:MAG: sugar-binding domain-containing protein [Bacillota bacterium]